MIPAFYDAMPYVIGTGLFLFIMTLIEQRNGRL